MKLKALILTFLFISFFSSLATAAEHVENDHLQTYRVQEHDTLMIIAFKIYGDYRKWKELLELNPKLREIKMDLSQVDTIKFDPPTEKFKWQPLGNPYLIKKNDTLGSISMDVYNTSRRWREIYLNNKPLIRYPNLIFAGFTIYYVPDPVDEPITEPELARGPFKRKLTLNQP